VTAAPSAVRAPAPPPATGTSRVRLVAPVAVVVALAVLSDTGTTVPRPFFAELVLQGGATLPTAALLFLLPSLGALLVLPAARLLAARLGDALLPLAGLAGAAGLLAQAAAPTALPLVAAGRLGLGAGLGLLAVALDLRLFAAVGTGGTGFAFVETGRSVALLAAPLLATVAATTSLVLPLVVGAALLGATALLAAASSAVQPAASPQEPARASYA
jgi:MFS family permease